MKEKICSAENKQIKNGSWHTTDTDYGSLIIITHAFASSIENCAFILINL